MSLYNFIKKKKTQEKYTRTLSFNKNLYFIFYIITYIYMFPIIIIGEEDLRWGIFVFTLVNVIGKFLDLFNFFAYFPRYYVYV